jgi:hypothetical protein
MADIGAVCGPGSGGHKAAVSSMRLRVQLTVFLCSDGNSITPGLPIKVP